MDDCGGGEVRDGVRRGLRDDFRARRGRRRRGCGVSGVGDGSGGDGGGCDGGVV